ncbi:MAG: hypothetical protein ICCCNLDF_02599 [Planctomycetes bacterium]|nr:hypothetical protein [Planctomycetota bacterium]
MAKSKSSRFNWAFKNFDSLEDIDTVSDALLRVFPKATLISDKFLLERAHRVAEKVKSMGYTKPEEHAVVKSDRDMASRIGPGSLWTVSESGVMLQVVITKRSLDVLAEVPYSEEAARIYGARLVTLLESLPSGVMGGSAAP